MRRPPDDRHEVFRRFPLSKSRPRCQISRRCASSRRRHRDSATMLRMLEEARSEWKAPESDGTQASSWSSWPKRRAQFTLQGRDARHS